ncbi:hypothetical protein BASA81_008432 [Batrachochytrium salamandrivorans]|nr:hypothetical protein BASA81_008432 [Batrachochytrium salamandrivorans]
MSSDELVLASGVGFFSEDFQALPKVVEVLLTKSTKSSLIVEDLKSDLLAVDHALSTLLFNSTQASDDLVASSHLLVSLGAEIESNKAELRDVHRRISNSIATLSGKRRDLNSSSFRKTQVESGLAMLQRLQQCLVAKTPQELALAQEICTQSGFQIELQTRNTSLELKRQIFGLFREKHGQAQMRLLLQDLFQVDPEQHAHMVGEIEAFVVNSEPSEFETGRQPSVGLTRLANHELKFISLFPSENDCHRTVGAVRSLIEWGDWVMQLRPLLPNVSAESLVITKTQQLLKILFENGEDDDALQSLPYYLAQPLTDGKLVSKPSAYFLSLIANDLVEFATRHAFSAVLVYLKHVYSTLLLGLIQQEAKLTNCSLNTASECYDSFHELRGLAKELDLMVFYSLSCLGLDNYVMLHVFDPFVQLVLDELDVALDDVEALKQDPLYQALIRTNNTVANRDLLIEASWEYFQSQNTNASSSRMKPIPESKIPVLVVLHDCFSTQEDLKQWGDLALFRAREALCVLIDTELHSLHGLDLLLRQTQYNLEFWVQSNAVMDFVFLPVCFKICQAYATREDLTLEDLFWIQSAFQNQVVEAMVFACKLRSSSGNLKRKQFWKSKLEQTSCCRFLFTKQQVDDMMLL